MDLRYLVDKVVTWSPEQPGCLSWLGNGKAVMELLEPFHLAQILRREGLIPRSFSPNVTQAYSAEVAKAEPALPTTTEICSACSAPPGGCSCTCSAPYHVDVNVRPPTRMQGRAQ